MAKEAEIQRLILDWLAATGVLAYRMNTGAVSAEHNGKKRFMRFGVLGMADILAFPDRGVLWIEVKSPDGRQSEAQKSFQAQVEAHGHRYVICRSLEDVQRAIGAAQSPLRPFRGR